MMTEIEGPAFERHCPCRRIILQLDTVFVHGRYHTKCKCDTGSAFATNAVIEADRATILM